MPLPEVPPQGRLPFEPPNSPPPDMVEFWDLWRQEKFWACHEALEDVWRRESRTERRLFLQGLIHCAVAVFQHRRGNAIGAARQWVKLNVRLESFRPEYEGLNLEALIQGVRAEIEASLQQPQRGLSELETRIREKSRQMLSQ